MDRSSLIISLIIVIDLAGMFYGYYFYAEQLGSTPLYLWLFVPDCPFYVMLFAIALVLAVFGFESKLFSYIAAVGMMKYGIWTLAALLLFRNYFFSSSLWLLSSVLFILHIGMFSEGPLLIPKKLSGFHIAVALPWFLIHDYFDYFYGYTNNEGRYVLGTRPVLPSADGIAAMMLLTILLSILLCFLTYVWSFGGVAWPGRKELRDAQRCFQKTREKSSGRRRSSR
ncbi:DUF1405 domain-containing protein [Candidatus Micrarchaeota archaeon]|nr:DUF1405 domain-containing protein [Candidatus Micrarchaeota archaeon]